MDEDSIFDWGDESVEGGGNGDVNSEGVKVQDL